MSLDWLLLYLQVAALVVIVVRELIRLHRRNLYAVLIAGSLLVMVHGQAWWMFAQFDLTGYSYFQHLNQFITLDGARRANVYTALAVAVLVAAYGISMWRIRALPPDHGQPPSRSILASKRTIVIGAGVFVAGAAFVVYLAGGPIEALLRPGQSFARGLTMFLLIASVGKVPALYRLSTGLRPTVREFVLFAATTALVLLNSRFLAVFLLLQLTLTANYCRRELSRLVLFGALAAVFSVLIVFGLYRDELAKQQSGYANPEDYVERRLDSITNWFYRANIEGFAGFAGLLSVEDRDGLTHDFGVSELRVLTQFVPYSIRTDPALPFAGIATYLQGLYPYSGSVVTPGMENAYAHFGMPGVLGLGGLLGWLATWLHVSMSSPRTNRLIVGLVSVHALQLIRGSFFNTLFFGISEVLVVLMLMVFVRGVERAQPLVARWVRQTSMAK
jgi:hypothetical protein